MKKMTDLEKLGFRLPTNEGWVAVWFDEKGKQHTIPDSERKTKASALRIADEYMLINQVQTDVVRCFY